MSIHKAKPKLKRYKLAGLTKRKDVNNSRVNFFLPEHTYLSNYLKKLEHTFSNSLNNRRRIKLLFGFNQTYKLLSFIKEIETFNMILKNNGGIMTAIIGGSKVSDKMPMLEKLSTIVDYIFVAGNNLNSIQENSDSFNKISSIKAEIIYASDGFGNVHPRFVNNNYIDLQHKYFGN